MKKISNLLIHYITEAIKNVGSADDICAVADELVNIVIDSYDGHTDSEIDEYLRKMGFRTIRDVRDKVESFVAYREEQLFREGYLTEECGRIVALKIKEAKKEKHLNEKNAM